MIRSAIVSYLIDVCLDLLDSDMVVKFTPVEFRFLDCVVGRNYWITFTDAYREGMRKSGMDGWLTNSDRVLFHVTGRNGSGSFLQMSGFIYRDSTTTNAISAYIDDKIIETIVPA